MYKGASASLQRRHKVHEVDYRASAYVHVESDFIPTAANMSLGECLTERQQLLLEKAKAENELTAAKGAHDERTVVALGHRLQGYASRLGLLKRRLKELAEGNNHDALSAAIREIVPEEMLQRIWDRQREIRDAAVPATD